MAEGRILPTLKETGQMFLTFLLVVIGWIIFRAESVSQAWEYICGMMQFGTLRASYRFFVQPDVVDKAVFIILMLIVEWVQRNKEFVLDLSVVKHWYLRYMVYLVLFLVIFVFGGQAEDFIYFQF